jgi:hypothetical protein
VSRTDLLTDVIQSWGVGVAKKDMAVSVAKKGGRAVSVIKLFQLSQVLQDRPQMDAVSGHQARGLGNLIELVRYSKMADEQVAITKKAASARRENLSEFLNWAAKG